MFHTGLHSEYHTPHDDLETLNVPGIASITRLLFRFSLNLASVDKLEAFRPESRNETEYKRRWLEQGTPKAHPDSASGGRPNLMDYPVF